jgi:hypothetical protein
MTILSSAAIDPASMEPDYNAVVTLEAAGDPTSVEPLASDVSARGESAI